MDDIGFEPDSTYKPPKNGDNVCNKVCDNVCNKVCDNMFDMIGSNS